MLNIKTFRVNPISENCYIVSDETKEAVIIDCGCFNESEWAHIKRYISDNELKPVHALNTHLHFDHALGLKFVQRDYGLLPEANKGDQTLYEKMGEQLAMFFGIRDSVSGMPKIGNYLRDGNTVTFGSHELKVLLTPGHTPGSVCFYCETEKVLFSGDTLFQCSVGRTDLEGGSQYDLMHSLTRLSELPRETEVYPGHGGKTNIGFECDNNPYF